MENILSQDEVDALLRGLTDGEIESESDEALEAEGDIKPYDLASQDRIVRGRMPTLEIIGERFARLTRTSLSNMLGKLVEVTYGSIKTLKFGEFLKNLPIPSSLHILKMEPLRGHELLIVDSKLVFLLIDCFFGSSQITKTSIKVEGREFTAIENRIIKKVIDNMIEEWNTAWKPVYEISTVYIRSEINPQFASIVPPTDIVIQVSFNVEVEDVGGTVIFCIPYSNIEPIRSKLHAGYQSDQFEIDETWIRRLKERLYESPIEISVELGRTTILGKDLINLDIGDTIILDKDSSDPLIAMVEGVPKFKAKCGIHKGNIAIKIDEYIETPKL